MSMCFVTEPYTLIEIPPHLTTWDLCETVTKTLRRLNKPFLPCVLDMQDTINVYHATVRLIQRIYERAVRLGCPIYFINASETVRRVLSAMGLEEKIPAISLCQLMYIGTMHRR